MVSSICKHYWPVVLLSLRWPHVIGTVDDAAALDQIATESVAKAEKLQRDQKFQEQLIPSIIDTAVHYENSNGFVPMVATTMTPDLIDQLDTTSNTTWTNSLNDRNNSTDQGSSDDEVDPVENDEVENDPAYSTEARIFLNFPRLGTNNRRSFEYQGGQNDFELLKVRNDTPVIANYPDFYEDSSSIEAGSEKTQSSSRHRSKSRGNKLDDYTGNYGMISSSSEELAYNHHYPTRDKEKTSQEKVTGNYRQQDAMNYDGHGQSATKQNGQALSSLSRPNQEVNNPIKSGLSNYDDAYDSMTDSSQLTKNQQGLSRPVVVAEYSFEQPRRPDSGINDYHTSRIIDSASSEMSHHYTIDNRDGRFRSDEDSRDVSEDGDYSEYTERPRRLHKSRRRPSSSDHSKRLPKEHRGSIDDSMEYEQQGKRHHSSRTKSHRHRLRGNSWTDDDRHRDQDDSYEESRYDGRASESRHTSKSQSSKFKSSNSWNQISPNLEISHSSGVEIGQLEKPKFLVPVKLNLVPVANFDHATALGNSQGFDMSNAVLQNIVSATPMTPISTPTPLISSSDSTNEATKYRVSTSVPDIVVGQNSFQNSMQAVLPHINDQDKFSTNLKHQYVSSTVAPVFAVTPNVNSVQSVPIQDIHGSVSPRPAYINQVHQMSSNQGSMPQLIVPQPTMQTVPALVQTPVHSPSDFNIQVNPHGMHGQNVVNHGNMQVQSIPTMFTVPPTPQTVPVTKTNLVTAESQSKKSFHPGTIANFLATASLSVSQNRQGQSLNDDSYYLQSSNTQQIVRPQETLYQQVMKNVNIAPKSKTYIQTTHLLPMLQPMPTVTTITASAPQVVPEQQTVQSTNYLIQPPRDQSQQFVNNNGASTLRNIKLPSLAYQMIDNVGSHSSSNFNAMNVLPGVSGTENAQLPYVGTKNVEILNPNIKPSPIDGAIVNTFETMHYPTAVFTTPIPMFTSTSVVTTRPALLSSSTDSNNNLAMGDMKAFHSQERPVFNPINFIPNINVVKNQHALNSKLHATEPLQQNLNLVPLIPGGNFFKPSFNSQTELLVKPKLNSDLETYAEQMFKESLKTIYNSQKWNNDRKPGIHKQNSTDSADITKLKKELQRLKASLSESKRNKDHEAHHSETKLQTAELPSKKPDELLAALEQMLKSHPGDSFHSHYGSSRPHKHRRPGDSDKHTFGSHGDFRDNKPFREFMSPPHSGSRAKGHFHDKPGKKRPGSGPRYNGPSHYHGPRSHHRHNLSSKSGGLEASSSNIDSTHVEGPQFENFEFGHSHSESMKGTYDSSPSFSGSPPERNGFMKSTNNYKANKDRGYNHPKMHNFYGLLMKNKQLPMGGSNPNYFRDKDQLKKFFEDEKRTQQQIYDDTLRDYLYKLSEGNSYSDLGHSRSDSRRSLTETGLV
ncbi:uncharacterized protein LOC116431783 [Nomia melanderi]|uniref:uncharacterized protein LOC116431783 n=1 Tax=Nomia melanderi TaxID=2448451 RepID=UPI003FCDAFFC